MAEPNEQVEKLLDRWEDLRDQGQEPTIDLLCAECPELAGEVRRQIAELGAVDRFLENAPDRPRDESLSGGSSQDGTILAGRYRALRFYRKGGLGEVFIARDEELGREVALKRIRGDRAADETSRARFLAEAELTSLLEHPGVVPVYGLGRDERGELYYAMRFIRGQTLGDVIGPYHEANSNEASAAGPDLRSDSLAFQKLLRHFLSVCQTVAYAHSRGVLHRDLKPANVLLGEYGETLVVDWGLAKVVAGAEAAVRPVVVPSAVAEETQPGAVKGSPAYMSPEQAEGRWDTVGPASDVYSLGATLYELLTGRPPFAGPLQDVLAEVRAGRIVPPRQVRPAVPPALEAVCLKAMSRTIAGRYPSALAMAEDVERWLADEPVTAMPDPWKARLRRWVKRRRVLVSGVAAAAFVTLLSLIGITILLAIENDLLTTAEGQATRNAAQAREEAQAKEKANRALTRNLYFNRVMRADLERQADNIGTADELLAQCRPQPGEPDLRYWEWHYLNRLCHRELMTFEHSRPVNSVAFDGGKLLATAGDDGVVVLWDTETRRKLRELKSSDRPLRCVRFGPDGRLLAAGGSAGGVQIWNVADGRLVYSLDRPSVRWQIHGLAFSPDGNRLAVAHGASLSDWYIEKDRKHRGDGFPPTDPQWHVSIWDLATGTRLYQIRQNSFTSDVAFTTDGKLLAACTWSGVTLWSAPDGKPIATLAGTSLRCMAIASDGSQLAAGGHGEVTVWDVPTRRQLLRFRAHDHWVTSLAYHPSGKFLVSASGGLGKAEVRVWEPTTGRQVGAFRQQAAVLHCVAFSPDGDRLATCTDGPGAARVWRFADRIDSRYFPILRQRSTLAISPTGRAVAYVDSGKVVVVGEPSASRSTSLSTSAQKDIAFSPDGAYLAGVDASVQVWELATQKITCTIRPSPQLVFGRKIAFHPDGRLIVVARWRVEKPSPGKTGWVQGLTIWDRFTGQEVRRFPVQPEAQGLSFTPSVAVSPEGDRLACSLDEPAATKPAPPAVIVWDTDSGKELLRLSGPASITSLTFGRDGKTLLIGSGNGAIHVWDLQTGEEVKQLTAHPSAVHDLAFSADGKRLVSASGDGTLKVWDGEALEEVFSLRGPPFTRRMCFSRNGEFIAVLTEDAVHVWDGRP